MLGLGLGLDLGLGLRTEDSSLAVLSSVHTDGGSLSHDTGSGHAHYYDICKQYYRRVVRSALILPANLRYS